MTVMSSPTKTLDIEDASQLSMIAYERAAYGAVEGGEEALSGLQSDEARQIGAVLIDPAKPTEERIRRAADYFLKSASETAKRSEEFARRPRFVKV
jgi:hypothetical protein